MTVYYEFLRTYKLSLSLTRLKSLFTLLVNLFNIFILFYDFNNKPSLHRTSWTSTTSSLNDDLFSFLLARITINDFLS